jgi:hypothetical protein
MKIYVCLIALLVTSVATSNAEEKLAVPDTIVVSAIISDPERGLTSETLVIRCSQDNRAVWQFRGRKNFSGDLSFPSKQFQLFATALSSELNSYSLDRKAASEIYVYTILSEGKVLVAKAVGEDFFRENPSSSSVAKPLLECIRGDVRSEFYLYGYLATTFPYEQRTHGYMPGKPKLVRPPIIPPTD